MNFYIIVSLVVVGIFLVLVARKRKEVNRQAIREHNKIRNEQLKKQYENLRNNALATAAHESGVNGSVSREIIHGICLDYWELGEIASLFAFWSGGSSVYFSTGPFIDLGREHDSMVGAAYHLIKTSQNFLPMATPTKSTSLPEKDEISLFLLTNVQKYKVAVKVNKTKDKDSPWFELLTTAKTLATLLYHYGVKRT